MSIYTITLYAPKKNGYPFVMKIVSPDIIHKLDPGRVKIGIKNDQEILATFKTTIDNIKNHKVDLQDG